MGTWSPEADARYGRFHFARERVVEWNCVFRRGRPGAPVPAGRNSFRQFVVVGDLATVRETLRRPPAVGATPR